MAWDENKQRTSQMRLIVRQQSQSRGPLVSSRWGVGGCCTLNPVRQLGWIGGGSNGLEQSSRDLLPRIADVVRRVVRGEEPRPRSTGRLAGNGVGESIAL